MKFMEMRERCVRDKNNLSHADTPLYEPTEKVRNVKWVNS
jgi:hypothetical protein